MLYKIKSHYFGSFDFDIAREKIFLYYLDITPNKFY